MIRSTHLDRGASEVAFLEFRQGSDLWLPGVEWLSPGLVRVARGTKEIQTVAARVQVETGGLLWIPGPMRADVHNVPERGLYCSEVLLLAPELLAGISARWENRPEPGLCRIPRDKAKLEDAWQRVTEGFRTGLPYEPMRFRVLELLAWVEESGVSTLPSPLCFRANVLSVLGKDPGKTWRVDRLAALLGMSADSLQRRLRAEGASFRELLLEARLSQALRLLQTTDQTVGWIAQEVGFSSDSRFCRHFRTRFGVTPARIR